MSVILGLLAGVLGVVSAVQTYLLIARRTRPARDPWPELPPPAPIPPAMPHQSTLTYDEVRALLQYFGDDRAAHLELVASTVSKVVQASASIMAPPAAGPDVPPVKSIVPTAWYAEEGAARDISDPTDAYLPPITHRVGATLDTDDPGIPGFAWAVPSGAEQ